MAFHRKIPFYSLFAFSLLFVVGCSPSRNEPIRIGFIGGLTGLTSNIGIAGRDGVILAVEQINRRGGIDGRKIELIIKDDKQDEVASLSAMRELVSAKVPVVIGPMTSSMVMTALPVAEQGGTLVFGPTGSTMRLGGLDDNYLRIYPQCDDVAGNLADYVFQERKLRKIAIIQDRGNHAFTEDWKKCFSGRFESQGGEISDVVSFDSGGQHSFYEIVNKINASRPDGLLILANSLDAAMFAQQNMKMNFNLPLFATEWSMTRDLIRSGGRSVEGLTIFHTFDEHSEKKEYLEFKASFRARFGRVPSFPAIHAYDTMQLVIIALQSGARSGEEIKKVILNLEPYNALQALLKLDQFGDIKRDLFLTIVQEGQFKVLSRISFTR